MSNHANPIEAFINKAVNKHDIVIFAKSYCPYCQKTKELMRQNHWDAQVYDLGHMTDGMSIQAQLLTMTGQATVPSVWINGKFLGGNSDTQSAFQTGELSRMLNGTNHANSNLAPAVEN